MERWPSLTRWLLVTTLFDIIKERVLLFYKPL